MKNFKQWVIRWFIYTFIASMLIICFNYLIDDFDLFGQSSKSISKDLENNYYVTSDNIAVNRVENIYEYMIKDMKTIDVLAIGSSRIIKLHKNLLLDNKDVKYYNFTDGTANLRHYFKIIGLFNKYNKLLPKNIILGIDPWVFDRSISFNRIKRLLNSTFNNSSKYLQLFNFEYTKINFKSLFFKQKYQKSKKLSDLLNIKNKNIIISPNGDLYGPYSVGNKNLKKLIKSIKNGLKSCDKMNANTKCVKYKKLNNFKQLKFLIDYLRSKDVEITVFFAPFEPIFFNHIIKEHNFSNQSKLIKSFFIKNGIDIIGSYNPHNYNFTTKDFLDGLHAKENVIKIIFKNSKFKQNL